MYCDAYGNVYCGYYNDEGLDGDGDGGAEGRVARPQEGSKQRLERKKKERRERKAWLMHAKKDWDKYKASGWVWQVEQTYEAAMTSLNGRHESFLRQANLSLAEWRDSMAEQSLSALFLAMWLADDLDTELDHDVT